MFGSHSPHHPVGSLPDVGQVAVARPDVESLAADELGPRPGAGAAASRGRHRSCRHYEGRLLTRLLLSRGNKRQLRAGNAVRELLSDVGLRTRSVFPSQAAAAPRLSWRRRRLRQQSAEAVM